MVTIEEAIRISKQEGRGNIDLPGVLSDAALFKQACHDMYEMFEREVFDAIICVAEAGSYFADSVSQRMKKKLICLWENKEQKEQPVITYRTHHGEHILAAAPGSFDGVKKAVIITDVLSHGKDIEAAVKLAMTQNVEIVKIGVFVENSDFDARHKLLKGIPVECMFFTEDL